MSEVVLPSGRKLALQAAPFAVAKNLYQAVLEEAKSLAFGKSTDVELVMKDLLCAAFSSKKIELCLWECFKRCLIDDLKISEDSFEKEEFRGDYMPVCLEVGKLNILPFVKSLFVGYSQMSEMLSSSPA